MADCALADPRFPGGAFWPELLEAGVGEVGEGADGAKHAGEGSQNLEVERGHVEGDLGRSGQREGGLEVECEEAGLEGEGTGAGCDGGEAA